MISASEAVKLIENSDGHIQHYLDLIEPKIIELANLGKRKYVCYINGLWEACDENSWVYKKNTVLQNRVTEKLKSLGYIVKIEVDGSGYVPSALSDDYGNGPSYVNVCLVICW